VPQLVKGGKNVFGWSKVNLSGKFKIPELAGKEYDIQPTNKVILISGSKISGGFSIVKIGKLRSSPLSNVLDNNPKLASFEIPMGEPIRYGKKILCWTEITKDGSIYLPVETLKLYEIEPGDLLLSVRGSGLGVGFIVKGPIIKEAKQHPELRIFK